MPKLAKSTKSARDQGAIRGIRKHLATHPSLVIRRVHYTADSLAAVYEEHLRAMARVEELTIERRRAIAEEREVEARVARIHVGLKGIVAAMFNADSPRMREFGIEPEKKPQMTAETKKRANEKRQATRKRLGIMGKRQRARLKRGG